MWLFVCLLTVSLPLHPTHTCSCSRCVQMLHCVSLHAVRWQQSKAWDSPHLCMWAGRVYSLVPSHCTHSSLPQIGPGPSPAPFGLASSQDCVGGTLWERCGGNCKGAVGRYCVRDHCLQLSQHNGDLPLPSHELPLFSPSPCPCPQQQTR